MNKIIERKDRNPRITVCYTPDENLMNDSFIGDSAVKTAHAINVERGWELPEDIHKAHQKEIAEVCYNILRGMPNYDWSSYKQGLESRGYKVHEQRDKQGVLHGYTILRGNSRFKSSTLGKGRNLTVLKLEATWKKLHPVAQVLITPVILLAPLRLQKGNHLQDTILNVIVLTCPSKNPHLYSGRYYLLMARIIPLQWKYTRL